MTQIPTAKEFYDAHYSDDAVVIMRDFAKLHVEAALKRAYNNQGMSWTNSTNEETKMDLFIKNSYSLTNIK